MANELVHGSVGTTMTQAEFEAVGLHVLNSQATGDLIYASSSTQLSRLAKGTQGYPLVMGASVPQWGGAITLNGTVTLGSQVFDAGAVRAEIDSTLGESILLLKSTQDGTTGSGILCQHNSASPANADRVLSLIALGKNSNAADFYYGVYRMSIENVTAGSEAGFMEWQNRVGAAWNLAMTLSSAGVLAVDLGGSGAAAQVDLFDQYDDAQVLRQGIQQNNRELLADMGVLTRKDSGSGYMMKLQPMVRLLAGGIYQTRQMLEDTRDELSQRLEAVEKKLLA